MVLGAAVEGRDVRLLSREPRNRQRGALNAAPCGSEEKPPRGREKAFVLILQGYVKLLWVTPWQTSAQLPENPPVSLNTG